MPWNARAGLVLPVGITAAVLLLGNCGPDKPLPTDATGASGRVMQGEGAASILGANRPDTKLLMFPGDSSTETCEPGERCVIQGQTYENTRMVFCPSGPGNCGTGNYEWSLLNPPPSSTVTFDPAITALEQVTYLTIETDSATPSGVYQSVSRATKVSGTAGTVPDFPYPIRVLCSTHYNQCPSIEIVDMDRADTVVSDPAPTQSTVIGKRVHLRVQYKSGTGSGSYTLSEPQWTMSGDSLIRKYVMDTNQTELIRLDQGSLNDSLEIMYYHSLAQNGITVKAKATLNGSTGESRQEATATYDVSGPTMASMTGGTIPGGMEIGPRAGQSGTWLHFGDTTSVNDVGIAFNFLATAPANGAGHLAATQLFTGEAIGIPVTGDLLNMVNALDDCPLYGNRYVPIGAGSDRIWTASDSPGMPLASVDTMAGMVFFFRTYFMYRPDGTGSIWVPIGVMNWDIGGIAGRDTTQTYGWAMLIEDNTVNPSGAASSEFPTWSQGYRSDTTNACSTGP